MAAASALWVDGEPASADDLAYHVLFNYGAYTSFRVEGGGVRGLDLHLARLDASARELFGEAVGEDRLRDLTQRAMGARTEAWLRVSLFSPEIWMRQSAARVAPRVMIGVFDPPPPLASSVRLQVQTYEREAAHLKHAATFGLMRARRAAVHAGFDDVLFADRDGVVSEGTLWNIGLVRGDQIVWPQAPMLAGVTQALLRDGLSRANVSQTTERVLKSDLQQFDAAFICNSATPACAVTEIAGLSLRSAPELIARLTEIWRSQPRQTI